MGQNEIVLNLLFKDLEWLSLDSFSNRKILQKTIYIIQEMGIGPYFHFSWYIHGPYSPALTETAYNIKNNKAHYDSECQGYKLSDHAKAIVTSFKELFTERERDDNFLELVASLVYLIRNLNLKGDQLVTELVQRKSKYKDWLDLNVIANSVERQFKRQ